VWDTLRTFFINAFHFQSTKDTQLAQTEVSINQKYHNLKEFSVICRTSYEQETITTVTSELIFLQAVHRYSIQ